jgi:hypothetical protein
MSSRENLQPELRQEANEILGRLSPSERETLLIKCWMSHDARWYMAVANEYGMPVVNRINRFAAHELGKVEARRVARALQLPSATSVGDYLLTQEVLLGLFGPDLLDYRLVKIGDNAYEVQVRHCFAYDNAVRAGITEDFECGVFARVTGWLQALGPDCDMTPALGRCLKVQGRECMYTFELKAKSPVPPVERTTEYEWKREPLAAPGSIFPSYHLVLSA